MKIVIYLNFTFNLDDRKYKLYTATKNETKYIHVDSVQQPSIIKHITKSIATTLSLLSLSKQIFHEAAQYYR